LRLPILGSLLENYFVGSAKCPQRVDAIENSG